MTLVSMTAKTGAAANEVPMGAVVVGNRTNSTAYDTPATCTLNNTTVTGGRVYTYQKNEIAVKLNITGNSTINGAFVNGDGENGKATIVTESGTYSDLSALGYLADGATSPSSWRLTPRRMPLFPSTEMLILI